MYDMCLNLEKFVFGVTESKFLGFMISARDIEVNPDKVKATSGISPPRTINEVHRLLGRVNYMSRFFAKLVERNLPFFHVLRNSKSFAWTEECAIAFNDLKKHIATLPTLATPVIG
ncbi:uncharacterized protein [Phyllobates terribilis]|uniref:uncharacterized protein n=1 Tax=Phyllobates terribilis TaxID=111132 RepID=UPI003CCAC05D